MKSYLKITLILSFLLLTNSLYAWGLTGHRIVAEVAENNLSRKAKKQIKKIIGNQSIAYWANWPDFIKSDDNWKHADTFHYVNIPSGMNYNDYLKIIEDSPEENMYKKGLFFINELKNNKNLSLETKQHYLYFLIHIMGDAHQPMHVGRPEDLGGNKIKVKWFKDNTNIHSVWDSKLVDYENYSYTEYSNLINIFPKDKKKEVVKGTFADWIFESYQHANKIYSNVKIDDQLGYRYHYENKYIVEDQLVKGGLRLAQVLNDIFK